MRHQVGAGDVFGRDHRRQRHHLAGVGTGVQLGDVVGRLPKRCIGLQDHIPHAAVLRVLAHHDRAEMRLQGAVDISHRNVEQRGTRAIDIGAHLLRDRPEGTVQAGQFGPRTGGRQELFGHFRQAGRVARRLVLDPELKTTAGADARNGGRRDRDHDAGIDRPGLPPHALQDRLGVLGARLFGRGVTLLEIGEGHEERGHIGLVLPVDQTESIDDRAVGY